MKLTQEQKEIISAIENSSSLMVNAYAGSGKTSTIIECVKAYPDKNFLYLAFNKAIAREAEAKLPRNATCKTFHALAFAPMLRHHQGNKDKLITSPNPRDIAIVLDQDLEDDALRVGMTEMGLAYSIQNTVQAFLYSQDERIDESHAYISSKEEDKMVDEHKEMIKEILVSSAKTIWEYMTEDYNFPLGFDGYFKQWALTKPKLKADVICIDEAQDINPVFISLLAHQDHTKKIFVGDKYQQIYAWRKSINMLQDLKVDKELALTKTFRFSDNIGKYANKALTHLGATTPMMVSRLEDLSFSDSGLKTKIFRGNISMIKEAMSLLAKNKKVFINGGIGQIKGLLYGIKSLQQGRRTNYSELQGFDNYEDLLLFCSEQPESNIAFAVNLVQSLNLSKVLKALESVEGIEHAADYCLTTAHGAKGLEWDSVELGEDFVRDGTDVTNIEKEELRLIYVALTRAKRDLSMPASIINLLNDHGSINNLIMNDLEIH